ncbi:MAG: hypothetical protein GX974_09340 [Clostridiales bacterium]|nr:hypothetical protein [Clostridiales bacterium]
MKIGTLFDIEIYVNRWLLAMLAIFITVGFGIKLLTIFMAILIHELAHVLTARALGLQVKQIEMYPFGGLIKIETYLELDPGNEIIISLAGPIINTVVVIVYLALSMRFQIDVNEDFIRANLMLASFNILPALPLDGGRAVRAMLSREIGLKRATNIMANGGIVLSIFLIVSGIYAAINGVFNITIFIIAAFLIYANIDQKKAADYIAFRDIYRKRDTLMEKGSMDTRYIMILDDTTLPNVVKKFIPNRYHYINVIDYKMQKLGVISENQLIEGMIKYGADMTVGGLLHRENRAF